MRRETGGVEGSDCGRVEDGREGGWGRDNRLTAVEGAERREGRKGGSCGRRRCRNREEREREGRSGGVKRGWRQMR